MDYNVNRRMAYNYYFGPKKAAPKKGGRKAKGFSGILQQPSGPKARMAAF